MKPSSSTSGLLTRVVLAFGIAGIAGLCLAATYRDKRDFILDGFMDTVRLKIQSGSTQSSNAVEIIRGNTLELAIPGTNTVAGLKANLGIVSGGFQMINTSSNISFGQTFSAVPTVVVSPSTSTEVIAVTSVTTSNVVFGKSTSATNNLKWIAIGAP